MLQSPFVVRAAWSTYHTVLDVSDLDYTETAKGGFESATFTLPEWVDTARKALTSGALVTIEDTRNGNTAWQGYLDIPGKDREDAGQTWKVGATGAKVVLGDRHRPYNAIDTDLTAFIAKKATDQNSATAQTGSLPADDDTPALFMQFSNGMPVGNGSTSSMQYRRLRDSGQRLGGFAYSFISGSNPVTYEAQAQATSPGASELVKQASFNTTAVNVAPSSAGSSFLVGKDALSLKINRVSGGPTNVALDTVWTAFYNVWIRALMVDASGADISGAGTYANPYVLAPDVIIDAIHWFTNKIDLDHPDTSIDTLFLTQQIDQLAWPDGTRLPDVLDAINLLEPEMVYRVGAGTPGGGHPFELTTYDLNTPRYSIDTRDGWSQPGGELDLANSLTVYWTDRRGNTRASTYSTTVPELGVRVRDADPITLGPEVGSQAAADRVGNAIMDQIASVPFSGVATIAHRIKDLSTGAVVEPWEIQPGEMVQLADQPSAPLLRLTEKSYSDSDQAAKLTLGVPVRTTEELVETLLNSRTRKRQLTPVTYT